MSFASFLADAQAVRDRGDWLCILTVPGPAGDVTIRISRRGTATGDTAITIGTDTIAAHTPFRKRLLVAPTMNQAMWKSRTILGHSIPGWGGIEFQNADGGLDIYRPALGYRWGAATAKIYFCDGSDIQATIGKVFDGKLGRPDWPIGVPIKVPLLGRDADFEQMTTERKYRGTGYALELFGDKTVGFGAPAAVGVTGSLTIEGWLWLDLLPTGNVGFWAWIGGTGRPWGLTINATGTLSINRSFSTVTQTKTSTAAMGVKKWYHFAITISGAVPALYLWDEDAQTLTTEVLASFSGSTGDAVAGSSLAVRTATNATFTPWCENFRVWNVVRTPAEIAADRHREIPAGSIPASCVHLPTFNDGSGATVVDSSASAANGTITGAGTSTWLWVCEGAAALAGTLKPDVFGETIVAPVLLDPIRFAFGVAGAGAVQSIVSDEGGIAHTMDATAASFRAFITTTPAAGHCLPYLARGFFKLGSSPTLPVAALVQGYNGGTVGYANAPGTISRKLVTEGPGPLIVDPTGLDTASFTAYATATTAKTGIFLPQPMAKGAALDLVNAGGAGWWGFLRADPLFRVQRFTGPAVTADFNFDLRTIIDCTPAGAVAVVIGVVVRYAYNPVVLSEDQAAAAFRGTVGWQARKQEWQEQPRIDESLKALYPGAAGQVVTIDTALQSQNDAGLLADFLLNLLRGEKETYVVRLRSTGLQLKVGQTLTLTYTLQDGTQRAGLDGTKKFVILGTEDMKQRDEVKAEVWG